MSRAGQIAIDGLVGLAGYDANRRQFWAHRRLRNLLFSTAFEDLAPAVAKRAKHRLARLLPDELLLKKLAPLAAALAEAARDRAKLDAANDATGGGGFARLLRGADAPLDAPGLAEALDLATAGALRGRGASARRRCVEVIETLAIPAPFRRAVWAHRGCRYALIEAIDAPVDRRTKDRALHAIASLLLNNQNQLEMYERAERNSEKRRRPRSGVRLLAVLESPSSSKRWKREFKRRYAHEPIVRVLSGDPSLENLAPPPEREPPPTPSPPKTLADAKRRLRAADAAERARAEKERQEAARDARAAALRRETVCVANSVPT